MAPREMKKTPDHVKLLRFTDQYLADLECLREMFATVMPVLIEKDKERHKAVDEILKRTKKSLGEKTSEGDKGSSNVLKQSDDDEESNPPGKVAQARVDIGDVELLISTLRRLNRAETLFRKQSIVSLVSRFDEFLGSFLEIALTHNQDWLKSDKTITYKELIELKSIDTAIKGVISKEVEKLLRSSHEEQIAYIDDKLKLGIREHFLNLPCFLEVAERRNLFVHTGGLVSSQYVERCRSFKCSIKDVTEGHRLEVSEEYFEKAFSVFFEIGLRIGQAAFRRLFPGEAATADSALNKLAIKFLNYGDYELAEVITTYDLNIPAGLRSGDCENEYYARINRAIAQKRQGKDFEVGLKGVPWQAFHTKYKLCLHVLRDEFEQAAAMMPSDNILAEVGIEGFRTWPIFKDFRGSNEFRVAYMDVFKQEYAPDPERDASSIALQEAVIEPEHEVELSEEETNYAEGPEDESARG